MMSIYIYTLYDVLHDMESDNCKDHLIIRNMVELTKTPARFARRCRHRGVVYAAAGAWASDLSLWRPGDLQALPLWILVPRFLDGRWDGMEWDAVGWNGGMRMRMMMMVG